MFVQADGGWDVTSFCDPKMNTPGEPIINHWAERDETRQVGNLSYAPFAKNREFFEKYHRMMLVINGVDAQTNAHTVGIVHNWSGRNSEGYPTLGALAAAHFAPALPVGYLSFGGFSNTSGLTRFTRLDDPRLLREIAEPRAEEEGGEDIGNSTLRRQAQLTVLAFKTGVAVCADLWLGGFDTHANHDPPHEWLLGNLTGGVDFLWDYAEEHGVADRMVVMIGSDFGRTQHYNSVNGKDHWPIGSYVVMEKNQRWTGQAVGETDGLHFAKKMDPGTLRRDDTNGTIIYPKHVHKALRKYLGISRTPGALRFPFNNTEDFPSSVDRNDGFPCPDMGLSQVPDNSIAVCVRPCG